VIKLSLQVLTGVILVGVALRELVQLARYPRDPALRVLAPGLVCLASAASLGIPELVLPIARELVGHWLGPVLDAFWQVMAFSFAAFFALADPRTPIAQRLRTARREFAVLLIVVVATTAIIICSDRQILPRAALYRSWWTFFEDLIGDGYVIIVVAIGVVRAVRYLRLITHPWLRRSVVMVVLGASAMAIGVDVAGATIDATHAVLGPSGPRRLPVLDVVYIVGLLGGQTALAIGLVLPSLAEIVNRVRSAPDEVLRARFARGTTPLWRELTSAFPHLVLERGRDDGGAFARSTSEISDALSQLAPYYATAGLPSTAATGLPDPALAAPVIAAALRAQADGAQRAQPPYPRIEPEFPTWRERARWMMRLSNEVRREVTKPG
jgi:hypothetical protein